ncbi:MAG TPA: hypothetical protein VKT71_08655 [Candidatus Acidoferrales bacterium]|nr:hypothetical protein [Candidatus Acidoferrales bacterium]
MEGSTKLRARRPRTLTQSWWRAALLFVASLPGCGGLVGSSPPQPPPANISVTVAPANASVPLGGSQAFAATVEGTQNPAVSWSVNRIPGGNAAAGTIDASGVYTAPADLPVPASVSVSATSAADPSKSAAAAITVTSSFSVLVSGPSSVTSGTSVPFSAVFTVPLNSNPSRVISWSVSGAGCSGAACGTITSIGVFTAPALPPSPATVQVVATPQADPAKAAFVSVSIALSIQISVSPSSATLALSAVQTFRATVTGAQDPSVTWDVNGIVGGNSIVGTIANSQTDPDRTTYTSPAVMPAGQSVAVRARSNANPTVFASATIGFTAAAYVTLSPASATLALGERKSFAAQVNNSPNQSVTWLVNSIPGGNSAVGQICVAGSNPCQPDSTSNGGSVDFLAPLDVPSPNPVTITTTSAAPNAPNASAAVTILPHIVVSVQPGNISIAATEQQRFIAAVAGTDNQQVVWTITGPACSAPSSCGSIDSTGLYTGPPAAPSPDRIDVVATSLEDTSQSGTAALTITSGPAIFSLSPTSAYAGSAGGFTLLVSGNNFSPSDPGPGSILLIAGAARATSCALPTQCVTSLSAADLQSAGNLSVQVQNPDTSLSNSQTFVVLAPGASAGTISLTPGAPASPGNDIVVVDLSTNGGSGDPANVSLNVAAIGAYLVATSSCTLGASPVIVPRPPSGTGTADVCVFSVSGLNPFFQYTISGSPTPDITVSNREPLGLGILHLTLQVPANAAPGPRTLFVQNPAGDMAAATGALEVQ